MSPSPAIRLQRATEGLDRARAEPEVDAIFFAASGTQTFASDAERAAFRERWLGRYLDIWPEHFWLAVAPEGRIVGYLAGCLIDPAASSYFNDHPHLQRFASLTPRYPAHLHINVDPDWRSAGVGARLIEAFCADARTAGCPGVHVITLAGARNVQFYARQGFRQIGSADWADRRLVMLGRSLAAA